MAVCLRCGKQLGETAKFCGGCGYPVIRQQTATNYQTCNVVPSQPKAVVCLRCGKQLQMGVKFCSVCGYPTQRKTRDQQKTTNNQAGRQEPRQQTSTAYNANGNAVPPEMMTREQLIAEIDRMLIYFSFKQNLYDEFDRCIEVRNAELDRKERKMIHNRHNDPDFLDAIGDSRVRGMMLILLSSFLLFFIPFVYAFGTPPYSYMISIGCFLLSGLFIFLAVLCFRSHNRIKREERQETKKNNDYIDSIRTELTEYHRNYGNCIVTVYNANPRVLRKVRDYLAYGKANTLKEALLLAYS